MKTLLLTLALAATSLAMQDECKKEWDTQKLCFYNLFTNAVGMNDGYNILETSSLVKQCLQDAGCKVPKNMQNRGGHGGHHGGGGGSSEEDGGDNRRVKRGGDYQMGTPEMKQCMKEKFGGNPKDQVKECMAEKLPEGTYIPEKMLKPFHGGRKNSKCPYKKMMKFLAMTNTMDDRLNSVCDGDAAKVDQVVNCIQESTGVDVTNIDRDEVKATICEQKQSCFTDKLEGCRDQLQSMFMASCDCKMSIIEPKREQCMEELGVANHNPHASMTCDQLKAKIESEYDMCADNFVWPSDEEGQGHGHHGRRGGHGGHKLLRNRRHVGEDGLDRDHTGESEESSDYSYSVMGDEDDARLRRHVGDDGLDRDHTGSSEDDEDYSASDEAVRVRRHDGRDHTGESQASDVSDEADDSEVSEDAIRRVRRHGDHGDDETSEVSDSEEVVAVRFNRESEANEVVGRIGDDNLTNKPGVPGLGNRRTAANSEVSSREQDISIDEFTRSRKIKTDTINAELSRSESRTASSSDEDNVYESSIPEPDSRIVDVLRRVRRHEGSSEQSDQDEDYSDEENEDAKRKKRNDGESSQDSTEYSYEDEEDENMRVKRHNGHSGHHDHAHGDGEDCGCALKQVITTNTKRNKRHDHEHDHNHDHDHDTAHGTGVHSSSEEDDKMMAFFF